MKELSFSQILPVKQEQGWEFFSQPANLIGISPPHFKLRLLSGNGSELINDKSSVIFSMSLLPGLRIKWLSRFPEVSPPDYFIDIYSGILFSSWRHEHRFRQLENGTEVFDRISFSMNLPFLNPIAAFMIRKVFSYRQKQLRRIFE